MFGNTGSQPGEPVWRNSPAICALADGERHLGHVMKLGGRWQAFDATHFNNDSNGFQVLGTFVSLSAAKEAVSESVGYLTGRN